MDKAEIQRLKEVYEKEWQEASDAIITARLEVARLEGKIKNARAEITRLNKLADKEK